MTRRKSPNKSGNAAADKLMRDLAKRMEACPDAESLHAQVILPFMAALETVCGARGYLLNIYGDTSNLVFTGDEADAETIYALVENYLDDSSDE
jgi:hypothetical protein